MHKISSMREGEGMRLSRYSIKNILLIIMTVLFFGLLAGPARADNEDVKGLEKIKDVKVRNLDKKAWLLWTPNKDAEGYVIFEQDSTGAFVQRKRIKSASKSKLTVRNLENNKTYVLKIAAYTTIDGQKVIGKLSDEVKVQPFNTKKVKKIHPYYYKGTMLATVRVNGVTFKKGQSIQVSGRNSRGQVISIYSKGNTMMPILYNGKLYNVAAKNIRLSGFISNDKKAYSGKLAEQYVNYRGFSSPTKYFIWISTYGQHVYIFEGSKFNWKLVKNFLCATGMFKGEDSRLTATELGYGYVKGRTPAEQWSDYQWIYWCLDMHPGGWFHSWLYYPDGTSYGSSVGRLGSPSSHGCVRLAMDNIKWMYNHIPDNTVFYVN